MRAGFLFVFVSGCYLSHGLEGEGDAPPSVVLSPLSTEEPAIEDLVERGVPIAACDEPFPSVQWAPLSPCLRVTVDPLLGPLLGDIGVALDAWSLESCGVCFEAPRLATGEPPPDRSSIHFAPLEEAQVEGLKHLGELWYWRSICLAQRGMVYVEPQARPGSVSGDVIHQLGHVLGLWDADRGVDSVMAPDGPPLPTEHDAEDLCTRYHPF